MAARFTKLTNALTKGLADLQTKAAVEVIEYWEEQLQDVDVSGAKGIAADLHSLKAKLTADEVDGEAVKKLVKGLGEKTVRIAGRVEDEKLAEQLKTVGEGLEGQG